MMFEKNKFIFSLFFPCASFQIVQVFIVLLYVFTKPLSMMLNCALGKEVISIGLGQLVLRASTPS